MNETLKTILTRRSIRKFTQDPIPANILEDIVNAALHAPSGVGKQTWKFTVITNRKLIEKLADIISKELDRPGYDMYRPTALIIPSNERESTWGKEDNACALENIFLAAHSLGVGSVWINQLQTINDRPAVRAFLDELHIPANHVVYGMAALGYPDPDTTIPPKKRTGLVEYITD